MSLTVNELSDILDALVIQGLGEWKIAVNKELDSPPIPVGSKFHLISWMQFGEHYITKTVILET